MKRLICLLLTIIAMLSLLGCSNETESKLAELEARLQLQNENISNLEQKNNELLEKLTQQTETNKLQQEQLDNLRNKPIDYTAKHAASAPIFDEDEIENKALYKSFGYMFNGENYGYEAFKEYNDNELKSQTDGRFYALIPQSEGKRNVGYNEWGIYVDGDGSKLENPILYERFYMYDEVLGDEHINGDPSYEETDGGYISSIEMWLLIPLKSKEYIEKLDECSFQINGIEFGEYIEDEFGVKRHYANLYLGKEFLGTCHFSVNCYVSEKWFRRYIVHNFKLME